MQETNPNGLRRTIELKPAPVPSDDDLTQMLLGHLPVADRTLTTAQILRMLLRRIEALEAQLAERKPDAD